MTSSNGFANMGAGTFGITPPATPPRSPSARTRTSPRHGSAEQGPFDNFGRQANYRTQNAPRGTRRSRSPGDSGERNRSREERRRDPAQNGQPEGPVGFGFRLASLEQSLRHHFQEIQSHRTQLEELKPQVTTLLTHKTELEARLDKSFNDVNSKTAGLDKTHSLAREAMRNEFGSISQSLSTRMDKIEVDIKQLMDNVSAHFNPPPGFSGAAPPPTERPTPTPHSVPHSWSPLGGNQNDAWANYRSTHNNAGPSQGAWGASAAPSGPPGTASTPPPTATNSSSTGWAAGFGTNYGPWAEKDWTVADKMSPNLVSFDGQIGHYDDWRNRVKDHFTATNMHYREVFELIEKNKNIITIESLNSTNISTLPNVNWLWIASHLWTFIGKWMTNNQLRRRLALAQGEEFNGIELWRALFVEYMGGSIEMQKCERAYFINFPKCAKDEELQGHLQQWQQLRIKYGAGLPEEHLIQMFQDVLPDHVSKEIQDKPELFSLTSQLNWVNAELARFNDSRLSKWNMMKLAHQLKPKDMKIPTTINPVMAEDDRTSRSEPALAEAPPPPVPNAADMQANLERMIAAAVTKMDRGRGEQRSTGRSRSSTPRRSNIPNPRFSGCWCCGKEGHSRQNCPVFKAIKDKNGGKVPKDYEGAYEKSLKARKTTAAVLTSTSASPAPMAEFEETYLWPLITANGNIKSPKAAPTPVANQFEAFNDDDSEPDDENEMLKALSMLTPNIKIKSKKSKGMNMARIAAIARKVNSGEIHLPDVNLENNDEYECCWALVDSGAGVNVARKGQFANVCPVEAPPIVLSTASGAKLPNSGAVQVVTKSKEGIETRRTFYEAPVEMPILAVAELTKESPEGSTTRFRQRDGYLEDNLCRTRQHFVKRKGVYFMKLYTQKSGADMDVVRPETP